MAGGSTKSGQSIKPQWKWWRYGSSNGTQRSKAREQSHEESRTRTWISVWAREGVRETNASKYWKEGRWWITWMKNCTRLETRRGSTRERKKRKELNKREKQNQDLFQGRRVWSFLINKCYFDQRVCVTARLGANGTLSRVWPQSLTGVWKKHVNNPAPATRRAILTCLRCFTSLRLFPNTCTPVDALTSQSNQPNVTFNIKHWGSLGTERKRHYRTLLSVTVPTREVLALAAT